MKFWVVIDQPMARLDPPAVELLDLFLALPDPDAEKSKAYQEGRWDGLARLYWEDGRFPSGHVDMVVDGIRAKGHTVEVRDETQRPVLDLSRVRPDYLHGKDLRDYQFDGWKVMLETGHGICKVATGGGKCLGLGTPVMLFDGTAIAVEDVRVGMQLMGPDSRPRRVLAVSQGVGPLYEVAPVKGAPWVCNDVHVLSLVHTETGVVRDIALDDYLKTHRNFKHLHKLFRVPVLFEGAAALPVDPYFIGVWLGDGQKDGRGIRIYADDAEIASAVDDVAASWGLRARHTPTPSVWEHAIVGHKNHPNPLLNAIRGLGLTDGQLFIPSVYKTASMPDRLALLAGLFDTDGALHHNGYDFSQKSERLAYDVAWVCRSVGLAAYVSPCAKHDQNGTGGVYWRVSISGSCHRVPCRIPRKRAAVRTQCKDALRTGFTVRALGVGRYAGFELDGDGRFLLGDFTVTHNTAMCAALARYIWEETGGRVIVIVPKAGLAVQTAHEFHAMYNGEVSLGLLTQGRRDIGDVTIATYQTLAGCMVRNIKKKHGKKTIIVPRAAEPELDELVRTAVGLIIDEHHHGSASTIQAIGAKCPAPFRYGFSATPLKYEALDDARVIGLTGPVIYDVPATTLIERNFLSRPLIAAVCHPNVSGSALGNQMWYTYAYKRGIVQNPHHNAAVLRAVEWIINHGRQVLVLCRQKEQFCTLQAGLEERGISHHAVWGATLTPERTMAKRAFGEGAVQVLLGSEVLGEGEDIPNVEAVVLAEGVKVNTNVLQRIGRGMRLKPHCGNTVWIVDFIPVNHSKLFDHGLERVRQYEEEGHEVRLVEDWPRLGDPNYMWDHLLPFSDWTT